MSPPEYTASFTEQYVSAPLTVDRFLTSSSPRAQHSSIEAFRDQKETGLSHRSVERIDESVTLPIESSVESLRRD